MNFDKLNDQWRKQAIEGVKAMSKDKRPRCDSQRGKGNRKLFKCKQCEIGVRFSCEKNSDKFKTQDSALKYECRECLRGYIRDEKLMERILKEFQTETEHLQ